MKKLTGILSLLIAAGAYAQNVKPAHRYQQPVTFTAEQDHANMMEQLGIKNLRPGPSGNEADANHANYDESIANPCPVLPDVMTTRAGKKITMPDMWWKIRRPEIAEDMEREVYGRLPKRIPKVTWTVKITDREFVGRTPVIARQLTGHVDNNEYPLIDVNISMLVVIPMNVKGPVPLLMMLGRPSFPAPAQPYGDDMQLINDALKELLIKNNPGLKKVFDQYPAYSPIVRTATGFPFGPVVPQVGDPLPTEQLLADGWGYATIDPNSIQADNGAGITRGIIGLVNKGQPRKPDDWGALRAWAWGAARGLDYLETDSLVDAKKVGIEGVSRYGKAALVALAFEDRFAMGLIGSSGKGGTTLHRRFWGEAVESLTGGEYYWMAGNYMKYGADNGKTGKMSGCDLPVDSHELIAMCAPRFTFVSYGIPEKGDAKWLDQQGSYMAVVAAGPVFKLLGVHDIGVSENYQAEKMPGVNVGLLQGELAWRQHDGGHTDAPNMKYFITWADKLIKHPPAFPNK